MKQYTWGMHEVLSAATIFQPRFLGRIALVDLSWLCSQLNLKFTIEEISGVWNYLADDCK